MNEKLNFFVEGTFAQTEKIKVPFLILFIVTLILWLSLPVFGLLGAALGWFATVGTFVFVLSDLFCLALLSQKRVFCLKRLVVVLVGFLLLTKGHQFRHDHWFLHDLKPKFEQELASWRTNKARLTGAAVQQTVVYGFAVFGSTNSDGKIFATFHLPGKIPRENFLYTESILSAEELKNYGPPRMVTANWRYFNCAATPPLAKAAWQVMKADVPYDATRVFGPARKSDFGETGREPAKGSGHPSQPN